MKYMGLANAVEEATSQRINPSTLWRWWSKGFDGVKLKTWIIGGRRVTTIEAVQTFIEQRTKASEAVGSDETPITAKLRKELYSPAS